jgi:hypothetical protein
MIKRVFLFLFLAILIGYCSTASIFAQNERNSQNSPFSIVFKAILSPLETFLGYFKGLTINSQNIWHLSQKSFLSQIWLKSKDIYEKEAKEITPGIEKEFKKEVREMKGEIPKAVKEIKDIWQKGKEIINSNLYKTNGAAKGE